MTRSAALRLTLLAFVFAAGLGGARAGVARFWPLALPGAAPGQGLPGLRIGGEPVGAEGVAGAVAARSAALASRRVRLVVGDGDARREVMSTTLAELGVGVDQDAVTARALRLGRVGDALTRARLADAARRGELDEPLLPAVDAHVAFAKLGPLKEELDTAAVPARLDLDRHGVVAEVAGRVLDLDGAVARIIQAAARPEVLEIELPLAAVAPRVTRESLSRIDISHVLATFETHFSRYGDQGPRARNIEVASSHVDGLVLDPGQIVSFNEVVGERSEDNGFRRAFEIVKGEYKEGTGGGTCQVASTLHAIAFFGGLDILQRLPHSRPSAYIPPGLDATVVYPVVDLKLRNPFTFPVVVHSVVGAGTIRMELLGADKPVDVTFGKEVLSTTPFERKVEEDPSVSRPKRKQKGIAGLELFRSRALAYRDGRRRTENSRELYPPTKEIWQVPPGFDEATLPPLGEDLPKESAGPAVQASGVGPGQG